MIISCLEMYNKKFVFVFRAISPIFSFFREPLNASWLPGFSFWALVYNYNVKKLRNFVKWYFRYVVEVMVCKSRT